MAEVSFAKRIELSYRLVNASKTVVDGSRTREEDTDEDTARTEAQAQLVAARIESVYGSAGKYDDSDQTVGDIKILEKGVRLMYVSALKVFSGGSDDASRANENAIMEEVKALAKQKTMKKSKVKTLTEDDDY